MKKLLHARSPTRVADCVIDDLNAVAALALVLEVLAIPNSKGYGGKMTMKRTSARGGVKRSRAFLLAVSVAGGAVLLAGCLPPAPPADVEVMYQLTGTCTQTEYDTNPGSPCVGGDASITIANASGGTEQTTVAFPYQLTFRRPVGSFIYISGQLGGDGNITCTAYSNGWVVQTATSSGQFVIASCSGSA